MEYKFEPPPKPVGYWVMPGSVSAVTTIKFTAFTRPRWLTRKMMYYVFEWKWEDAK
jgi:hypothetical protein